MDIYQAQDTMVCTSRIPGLKATNLRVLRGLKGNLVVATDVVGVQKGNWVFTVSGSAARYAAGDFDVLTDLTIGGIIDNWLEEEAS